MFALLKKEIRGFLSSLIGYIVICVFLLLMGLFTWVFNTPANILNQGQADLTPLFRFAPMVFIFLIPAITMRSFAEEKRTGTIELLFTRPLSEFQIISAKYLAGLLLVIFSLLPTLLYFYTVNELGNPQGNIDSGNAWGSYLGMVLLGATFVSIGIFSSALTSLQIVSFLIGVFLCFFFFLGFDLIGSYSLFGNIDSLVKSFGIEYHYHSISRGVIDSRDIVYFISMILGFLFFTKLILESRKKSHIPQFIITILILITLNFVGGLTFTRIDLTEDKRHTLAPTTVNLIENKIEDILTFRIYLTGELPADLKRIEREIKEKLEELKAYGGSKIQYEFFDPYSIENEEDRLAFMDDLDHNKKIEYTQLEMLEQGKISMKYIFPGGTVSYGTNNLVSFNFFSLPVISQNEQLQSLADNAVSNIEFILVDAMRKASTTTKPRIAILQGHGEANPDELGIIYNGLIENYAVEFVRIDNKINAIRDYNALLIVQPDSIFPEKDKFVIDQFIMKGGLVAWFIDPMEVQRDTLFMRGQTLGIPKRLNLDDQLFTYGIRLNNNIILDRQCAPIDVPGYQGQIAEWFFYPLITPNRTHAITRTVDPIKTEYASSIDLVGKSENMKRSVLLESSSYSTEYKAPARINYGIIEMRDNLFLKTRPPQTIAVMLEGTFNSVFDNRIAPEFLNNNAYVYVNQSPKTKMLVVSDGNIPINDIDYKEIKGEKVPMYRKLHSDKYKVRNQDGSPRFQYGNREFVLNAIDYLLGDEELIALRQRTILVRRLNLQRVMEERGNWQMFNVALPVFLIILFGVVQSFVRRRKYTR